MYSKTNPLHTAILARRGGNVRRFHTSYTVGADKPRVDSHSWGVAVMVDILEEGQPSVDLLRAALYHDIDEQYTGDIPAPVKWANPPLREALIVSEVWFGMTYGVTVQPLNEHDQRILLWADILDLMLYCYEQRCLGNRSLDNIFQRALRFLHSEEVVAPSNRAKDFLRLLNNLWDTGRNLINELENEIYG